MKEKEFNLSKEIIKIHLNFILVDDVQEFIKQLKEKLFWENEDLIKDNMLIIDKLAGERLR